jgi:hypothetical protein
MFGAVTPKTFFASIDLGLGIDIGFDEIRDNGKKRGMTETGPIA